ncbi:hypothetical protein BpHYR1_046845 [Brachionus plicatilis]|uniref:Uncharacterized protein n=1 Tax=Brachionus plicatilis TaxID=10195 RepID=A0A3M7S0J0_BRAPC|nr:hypothetical protein BpHYR1_046845 [Brachionus plicatilis]
MVALAKRASLDALGVRVARSKHLTPRSFSSLNFNTIKNLLRNPNQLVDLRHCEFSYKTSNTKIKKF